MKYNFTGVEYDKMISFTVCLLNPSNSPIPQHHNSNINRKKQHTKLPIKLKVVKSTHMYTYPKALPSSKLPKSANTNIITSLEAQTKYTKSPSPTKRHTGSIVTSNIDKPISRKIKRSSRVIHPLSPNTTFSIDPNQLKASLHSFYEPKLYSVLDLLFSGSLLSTAYRIESQMANHYRPPHHFPITSKSTNTLPSSLYSTLYFNPYHLTPFELTRIPFLIFESALTKLNIPFNPHLLNELIHVIYQGYLANHYHNFYHAIDVLQSIYMFLKYLGLGEEKAPLLHIFTPKLVIALLVAALGHDIGHPGVNNQFLIQSSFPIASLHPPTLATAPILEEFHTQLLAHLITNGHLHLAFPTLFESADELNQLLRPIILATDMGAHFSYIERMSSLSHFPLHQSQGMTLACGLIKCADLINVARPLPISKIWGLKLDRELAHQSHLQSLLSPNPTVAPTPPSTKITSALVENQKSFMGAMVVPLFDLTTKLLPWLSPVNDQLKDNLVSWNNWENEN